MNYETDRGDDSWGEDVWLRAPLADLPTPAIPDDVAQRVSAALQAESQARQAAEVPTLRHAGRNRRWWYAAGGIAAAGIAVALAVSALPGGGGTPAGVTADASESPIVAPIEDGESARTGDQQNALSVVPVSSGNRYTADNMKAQVPVLIASPSAAAPPEVVRATFAATPAGIVSCLDGVGYPPQDLALLDIARFQDAPVVVLAYLSGAEDGTADVVVVGVRCSSSDPQVRHRDVANMTP